MPVRITDAIIVGQGLAQGARYLPCVVKDSRKTLLNLGFGEVAMLNESTARGPKAIHNVGNLLFDWREDWPASDPTTSTLGSAGSIHKQASMEKTGAIVLRT